MTTQTKPSTKSPYKVFLDTDSDGCTLEVKRSKKYLIYEINDNGKSSLLVSSESPYTPEKDQKEEIYYLDYLSASALQTIQVLTENYDFQEISSGLAKLKSEISSDVFHVEDFSMDHSYLFSDYTDSLKQLLDFTGDDEYSQKIIFLESFFNQYFYSFSKNWMLDDKEQVVKVLQNELIFIESLQSN